MTTVYKKRNIILTILIVVFLIALLSLPLFVSAQEAFAPLTKDSVPALQPKISFSDFLNTAFDIGLAVAATLAVVMITVGGFQYMTTDSVYNKTEGRDRIRDAIIGLLIALLIWLILFTINPNLLKFDINIGRIQLDKKLAPELEKKKINKGGKSLEPNSIFRYENILKTPPEA